MKLRVLSDLHLEHDPSYRLERCGEDAILCAGDLSTTHTRGLAEQFIRSSRVPFYLVLGNHDFYHGEVGEVLEYYRFLNRSVRHFHFLHNRTAQFGDYRLAGTPLWTDFALYGTPELSADIASTSIADFNHTWVGAEQLSPQHLVGWNKDATKFLRQTIAKGKPTIVMTHWCPSAETISPVYAGHQWNPYFTTECSDLMGGNVLLWVHGHSHAADDRIISGTRVIRNPKGYPSERSRWDERLIVEI